MKFWLTCFVLLFVGTELFQWLVQSIGGTELELSAPLTLLGGVGLALASNAWRSQALPNSPAKPLTQNEPSPASNPQIPNSQPQPAAPESTLKSTATKSISFEIHPPEHF